MAAAQEPNGGRSAMRLKPMDVPKASDVLANELRERILDGEFTEGMALPTERDLVDQTQMSRATVREALRILEIQGLVRVKAGRTGGAFIQRPGRDSVAISAGLLIRGQQVRLAALLETREAIEPFCAELAARHRTEDDIAALEAANEAIADESGPLSQFLEANIDWHVGVAQASHNELLAGLMIALSRAIFAATENERYADIEVRRITARAHRSVTEAIRQRDPETALRRMTRHIHTYAETILDTDSEVSVTPNG